MNADPGPADLPEARSSVVAILGGAVAIVAGVVAILGWTLGLPLLASLVGNRVPMAPSTALAFLLLGGAVCAYGYAPLNRTLRRAVAVLGMAVALGSLLILTLAFWGIHPEMEHPGTACAGETRGWPIGHMSPLTAIGVLFASASLLILLRTDPGQQWRLGCARGSAEWLWLPGASS